LSGTQERSAGEIRIGYRSVLAIAIVGVAFIVGSAFLGKKDLKSELPYDIGLACLILAAIEYGLVRGLAILSAVTATIRDIEAAMMRLHLP
jgi:hypothetical protein